MSKKKSIRVELDKDLHARAKIKSAITGTPIAEFCREAIRKWVDENHPIILPPK